MSADYYLLRADQAVGAAIGSTSKVPRKFRRPGVGISRSNAELLLKNARQTLKMFPENARLCENARSTIEALTALLSPGQSEADIRRELSAEHRKLEAQGGDPTRHQQLVGELRKRKRTRP